MRTLYYLTLLFSSAIVLSCSSDDDFPAPTVPGQQLNANEIQLVYRATAENSEFVFSLESNDSQVYVNWGDNGKLTGYPTSGDITYSYPAGEKEYIITLRTTNLGSINFQKDKAANLRGIYAGDCANLRFITLNQDNKLSALDVRKCPLFERVDIHVNTPDFDWAGLSRLKSLTATVSANTDINLTGFSNLTGCHIAVDLLKSSQSHSLTIRNCPVLQKLQISGLTKYPRMAPYTYRIENLQLDVPAMEEIILMNVTVMNDVDLEKMEKLNSLSLYTFECRGRFALNPALERLSISNTKPEVVWELDKLDLSQCDQMTRLSLEDQSGIKNVELSGLKRLEYCYIRQCNMLKELSVMDLPTLASFSIFENAFLESIRMSDLSELVKVEIVKNKRFSALQLANAPKVLGLNLSDNKLGSETIKTVFAALPGSHPDGGQRGYDISGNPGDLPEVHDFIHNLGQW